MITYVHWLRLSNNINIAVTCFFTSHYFARILVNLSTLYQEELNCFRFEDGTLSFLDIISLRHGFDILEKLAGIKRLCCNDV